MHLSEIIVIFIFYSVIIATVTLMQITDIFWSIHLSMSRFLYPVYPLICVAASAVIESFPDLFRDKYDSFDTSLIVKVSYHFT